MAQQEQFLNKGIWQDTEKSLQPEGTYNDSLNMRLLSNENNTFSLETIKGNKNILLATLTKLNPNYQVIGWTAGVSKVIVFSTNGPSDPTPPTEPNDTYSDANGEIGVFVLTGEESGTYTPVYNHKDLKFSTSFQIEARFYEENPKIGRVYWTDNHNPPRAININNPVLYDYQVQAVVNAPANIGRSYMVLRGTATVLGVPYGPNQVAGTVFVSNGLVTVPVNARVIAYSSFSFPDGAPTVETVDVTPEKELGNIRYEQWLGNAGNLLAGTYQYAYQLETSDGALSSWSYITFPTPLVQAYPGNTVREYQVYQGVASTIQTTKAIVVLIEGIDTNFQTIRVAAIHSTALGITDLPVVFFEGQITGTTMEVIHRGGENIETLTIDDLKQIFVSFKTVKTLEIEKNRLFYGNVETSSLNFDYDPSLGISIKTIEYLVPTDTTHYPTPVNYSNSGLNGTGQLLSNTPPTGYIFTDQWYQVTSGNLIYNASVYDAVVNPYFQGVPSQHTYIGIATVIAVAKIQKYGIGNTLGSGKTNYIQVQNDWPDDKGMAIDTFVRSYWRGETYRFGILIWDKFGNPTFVRWMNDKEMPQQYSTTEPDSGSVLPFNPRLAEQYLPSGVPVGDYDTSIRHIGIKIDNLDLNQIAVSLGVPLAELDQHIDGFSVVRAKRDPQVYAQGIMLETVEDGTFAFCTGSTYRQNNTHGTDAEKNKNVFNIYAPDLQFGYLNRNININTATDVLRTVDIRFDTTTSGGIAVGGFPETASKHSYEKYYQSHPGTTCQSIREKGTTNGFNFATMVTIGNESGVTTGSPPRNFLNVSNTPTEVKTAGALTLLAYLQNDDIIAGAGAPYDCTNSRYKPVVNFIRPNNNLYGGTTVNAKANTQYIYCGHYQKMDSAFMTYLTGTSLGHIPGKVDGIEVFGGDCFVNIYDFARQVAGNSTGNNLSFTMLFPVESDMNIALREGRHVSKDGSLQGGTNPNGVAYAPTAQPEQYIYNGVYSYEENNILYPALPVNFIPNNIFGYRIYYSNHKVNGEFFDSFKIFLQNNFIDVEGWAGNITNLRSKDGKLFYWQNHAFGYIPVQERITVGGGGLGTPTTIGEGGVATRFDELKRYYGNQHQWGLCETENSFVWFDVRRRAFCHASLDGNVIELSTIKGLISFFVNNVHGNVVNHDNPVNKKGITAAYDSRFREVIMTFKGITTLTSPMSDSHFTIGFNNLYKYFSGFYSFVPGNMIEFNNKLISNFEGFSAPIIGSKSYNVGDVVTNVDLVISANNDDNYVCKVAFTTPVIPVQPSLDVVHWSKSSSSDELYMHNVGDIAKFYGIVRDNYVRLVVNANRGIPKIFDNHLFLGMDNGFFFTDYIADNPLQSASDLGIFVSTRSQYQTYYSGIYSTIPTSTTGRMMSHWMQLLLRKDNKLNGSIIDSSNELIKFVSLQTKFRKAI